VGGGLRERGGGEELGEGVREGKRKGRREVYRVGWRGGGLRERMRDVSTSTEIIYNRPESVK